jgi:uncharacterized protein (DUF433 family)
MPAVLAAVCQLTAGRRGLGLILVGPLQSIISLEGGNAMQPIAVINRGRGPELAGTRITIYNVLPYFEDGWTDSAIAEVHNLSCDQVVALRNYFEQHREEVLVENAKIVERIAQGNPPEVEARRAKSHAKLQTLRQELQRKRRQGVNGEGHRG